MSQPPYPPQGGSDAAGDEPAQPQGGSPAPDAPQAGYGQQEQSPAPGQYQHQQYAGQQYGGWQYGGPQAEGQQYPPAQQYPGQQYPGRPGQAQPAYGQYQGAPQYGQQYPQQAPYGGPQQGAPGYPVQGGYPPPGPYGAPGAPWSTGAAPASPAKSRKLVIGLVVGAAVVAVALAVALFIGIRNDDGGTTGGGSIPDATSDPDGLGDDPEFDGLAEDCHDGDMQACDDLYKLSDAGSAYELYGGTCAGRQPNSDAEAIYCVDAFPDAD